jgi:hypothetical protein
MDIEIKKKRARNSKVGKIGFILASKIRDRQFVVRRMILLHSLEQALTVSNTRIYGSTG